MERVLVGMSGGIDSFVTALLLQQKGYEVVGVTLALWGEPELTTVEGICRGLDIPLIHWDGREIFREVVVEAFVREYLAGHTPSPCCVCNHFIKWELLNRVAMARDIPHIATGHYVRIEQIGKKYYIRSGVDEKKDQSYFLWGVSQSVLSKAITPLGEYTKAQVKAWALEHGYEEMVRRKESMGICFLRGMDYREFIRGYSGYKPRAGKILNRAGEVIGEHGGLLNYTIGQKQGMPVYGSQAMYVAGMDPGRNVIIADVKSGLYSSSFEVKDVRVADEDELWREGLTVKVRGLGLNPQGYVRLKKMQEGRVLVMLSGPAWAVAPGQPVVFYRENLVIGGGIVEKVFEA